MKTSLAFVKLALSVFPIFSILSGCGAMDDAQLTAEQIAKMTKKTTNGKVAAKVGEISSMSNSTQDR